jgi:SAM-dependent methyltransferase
MLRAKYHHNPLDLRKFINQHADQPSKLSRSLDIGSGPNPRNPFSADSVFGVDIRSFDINNNVKRCILGNDDLPFESNFFDTVTAYDVLEHIPRVISERNSVRFPFVSLMNEIWRVMKLGGLFYSETPCYPMKEAFQDPTHVNIMTEDTLRLYFANNAWSRIYGFVGSFTLLAEGWRGSHYFCILVKTSEVPISEINKPQKNEYCPN